MRNDYYQRIRGLCIILIVLIHLPIGLKEDVSQYLWVSVRQLINFPVAVFIFLSAYFCKIEKNDICSFLFKRTKRLFIPYIVFAVPYLFVLPIITDGKIPDDWFFELLTGYGPAYFLLVLIQLTLLTPIITRFIDNKWFTVISLCITPLYLIYYYYYTIHNGQELKACQTPFVGWYVFYWLGLLYNKRIGKASVPRISSNSLLLLVLISLFLSNIEGFFISFKTDILSFSISQIKITSILYSLVVILILYKSERIEYGADLLKKLGDYSMGIFMLHPFFNWVFKYLFIVHFQFVDYNSFPGYGIIHLCILVCSVGCSYVASLYLYKLSPVFAKTIGVK